MSISFPSATTADGWLHVVMIVALPPSCDQPDVRIRKSIVGGMSKHRLFIWTLFVVGANGSVVFPRNEKNSRYGRATDHGRRRISRRDEENHRRKENRLVFKGQARSNYAPGLQKQLAFSPLQVGKFLSIAALVGFLGEKLRSESVSRALYFWFHAGPVVAHYKFTRWYLQQTRAPLEKRDIVYNSLHDKYCNRCFNIALSLKGLYVKIAQIVSSRPDFVPPQYIELFTAVQDSIPQSPVDEVVDIIDDNLQAYLGKSIDEVFHTIDAVALGSASIGQVHRATLTDKYAGWGYGREVAVKVMHPGAEERFHHDFQVFRWLCKVALTGWEPILDECYRQIMTEFDYRNEASSLQIVREHLIASRYSAKVKVPEPYSILCTKELLVMEMLHGKKLSDTIESDLAKALRGSTIDADELMKRKRLELILGKEKMASLGYSSGNVLEETMKALGLRSKIRLLQLYRKAQKYIDILVDVQGHQMFSLGMFNGDPHPGNLLVLEDGKLGLIDFGQMKSITDDQRIGVARVVSAIGHSSSDIQIADSMRQLGFRTKFDRDDTLAEYGHLFFDSDIEGKKYGCATPQIYFARLNKIDPLISVPDVAIFVARSSFIIRGMGTVLGKQIRTSLRWKDHAAIALAASPKGALALAVEDANTEPSVPDAVS